MSWHCEHKQKYSSVCLPSTQQCRTDNVKDFSTGFLKTFHYTHCLELSLCQWVCNTNPPPSWGLYCSPGLCCECWCAVEAVSYEFSCWQFWADDWWKATCLSVCISASGEKDLPVWGARPDRRGSASQGTASLWAFLPKGRGCNTDKSWEAPHLTMLGLVVDSKCHMLVMKFDLPIVILIWNQAPKSFIFNFHTFNWYNYIFQKIIELLLSKIYRVLL